MADAERTTTHIHPHHLGQEQPPTHLEEHQHIQAHPRAKRKARTRKDRKGNCKEGLGDVNYQQRANQEKHVRGIITKQLDEIIIEVSGLGRTGRDGRWLVSGGHQAPENIWPVPFNPLPPPYRPLHWKKGMRIRHYHLTPERRGRRGGIMPPKWGTTKRRPEQYSKELVRKQKKSKNSRQTMQGLCQDYGYHIGYFTSTYSNGNLIINKNDSPPILSNLFQQCSYNFHDKIMSSPKHAGCGLFVCTAATGKWNSTMEWL